MVGRLPARPRGRSLELSMRFSPEEYLEVLVGKIEVLRDHFRHRQLSPLDLEPGSVLRTPLWLFLIAFAAGEDHVADRVPKFVIV